MWPALITGGTSLIGSWMGANQSEENNAAAMQRQQQSQQWQEHMSNTAYQRASTDMQAAGLNPAAMYSGGNFGAASTPSPVVQPTPQVKSPFENLGSIAKDMIGSAIQAKTLEKMTDEIANLQAERNRVVAETATEQERPDLVRQQANKTAQEFLSEGERTTVLGAEAEKANAMKELWRNEITRKIMQGGVLGSSAADIVKPIGSIVGGITNSALKSALIRKYGNASEMSGSATSWRRGYDAGRNEE